MSSEIDPPDDDMEMLAAELTLGLLTNAQLPHVVAQRHGGRFDRAVNEWEFLLLPLTGDIAEVQPPPRIWHAIAAGIAPVRTASIWNNLRFWRGFSLGTGVVALGLAALVIFLRPPPTLPVATALLASQHSGVFVATAERTNGSIQLIVSPSAVSLPANKSAELWLILPGAKPAPLGILSSNRPVAVTIATADLVLAELAVSIEPPGGSPSRQPTGPIISAAKFLAI